MAEGLPDDRLAGYAGYAQGALDSVRHAAEDAVEVALEVLGETIPRILGNLLLALAAGGFALVALGLMAIFATSLFVQLLAVLAGLALIATGALLFLLAWRLHAAMSGIRTVASVARRWRLKRAAREADARERA